MSEMKMVECAEVLGKRVLCRVDFNVPIHEGIVADTTRIEAALPTISYLVGKGARVILMSHLGRPRGEGYEEEYSLKPAVAVLEQLLDCDIIFAQDTVGPDAKKKSSELSDGQVLLLENLRFDAREKKNDMQFCEELASLADIYVDDAFGTAHRAHASTAGITSLLPSYAGFLLAKEVDTLTGMLEDPKKPFVAILGGSKVSDKVGVIDALIERVDTLIIGGGMCFTFLLAQGYTVGTSLVEPDWVDRAKEMIVKAADKGVDILLPTDIVVAGEFKETADTSLVFVKDIPDAMMGLDIGPETSERYATAISQAHTVFWNGPMGVFEMRPFEAGTRAVAEAVAANSGADTIIGGGDSVAAINKFQLADKVTFISTGGGASMDLVQGKQLPGVVPLMK